MTLKEFTRIAREMRSLQKEFFSSSPGNRRPNLVMIAKSAESRFDRALDEMEGRQLGLFDREERE